MQQIPVQRDTYQCGIIVLRMIEGIIRFSQECEFDYGRLSQMTEFDIGFPHILENLPAHRRRIAQYLQCVFQSGCRTSTSSKTGDIGDIEVVCKFLLTRL